MQSKYQSVMVMMLVLAALSVFAGCNLQTKDSSGSPSANPYDPQALFNKSGHADRTAEAWKHWDADNPPLVPVGCAKCHAPGGFLDFIADGRVDAAAQPGALTCNVCHTNPETGAVRELGRVLFPSGITITGLGSEAICMTCHQGRSSTPTVNNYLASKNPNPDAVDSTISFQNIHYFAAAATLYGKFAMGGYQYAGKSYDARNYHVENYTGCADCHDPHSLKIREDKCISCHYRGADNASIAGFDVRDIRSKGSITDFDGDGNLTEGIWHEINQLRDYLTVIMWIYGKDVAGMPIVYDALAYPYFFRDTNGNGIADPGEKTNANRYQTWTQRLLKAAYNFQVSLKDPGGFAHGGKYIIQLLYDSMEDLNTHMPRPILMTSMTRDDEGHYDGAAEAWRHWDAEGEVPVDCAKCHSAKGLPEYIDKGRITHKAPLSNGLMCSTCHTAFPKLRKINYVTFPSGLQQTLGDGSNLCMECHQGRASKYTVDKAIAASPGPYSFINIHYFPASAIFFGTDVKGGYEYPYKTYAGSNKYPLHGDRFNNCVECHMEKYGEDSPMNHNVARVEPANCVECHGRDVSQPVPGRDPALFSIEDIRPNSTPDYDADGVTTESLKSEIEGLKNSLYNQMKVYGAAIGNPIVYSSDAYPYFFVDVNGNGVLDASEAVNANRYRFNAIMLRAAYNYQMISKEPHAFIHNPQYVAQLLVDSIGSLGGSTTAYTWR